MQALSRKMNLDKSVDFSNIATNTEGFTGADLQSILYTAQLSTVDMQQTQGCFLKNKYIVVYRILFHCLI